MAKRSTTYRVRQVAAVFVLERWKQDQYQSYCWHIIEEGYSWNYAETTAFLYNCEIV